MTFTDEDLKRLKALMDSPTEYPLPWKPNISTENELWAITDNRGAEVITCDTGYYGPGVQSGKWICELINNAQALIARLEAAEARVRDLEQVIRRIVLISIPHSNCAENIKMAINEIVQEWEGRKACGK
jgi:hypothetical protein